MNGAGRPCWQYEQALAFVLRALDPDEEIALREHLPGCRSCQAAVADSGRVVVALAEAVEQVDPPAWLRGSILAQVARDGMSNATAADTEGPSDLAREPPGRADSAPTRAGAAAGSRGRGEIGPRSMRGLRGPAGSARGTSGPGRHRRRLVAAALVVVVVVGVGGLGAYAVQVQQQRDAQVAQTQALVDILTQLDRPGTSHATLSTSEGRPVAAVVAATSARAVITAGLSPNDRSTSVYVLWGVSAADPQPLATFDVDQAAPGPVVRRLGPVGGGEPFLGYAISLERGRHAPDAPTTVVASGQVQT